MKKKSPKSAFLNRRVLITFAFCAIAVVLTLAAFALYPGGTVRAQGLLQQQSGLTGPLAATIHVPADYPTIQAAVAAANPGDIIEVDPGSYPVSGANINKALTLKGAKAGVDARGAGRGTGETV